MTKPICVCAHCTCSVSAKLETQDQEIQLSRFFMGFSDKFTMIRGQILLMKPLPTLSQYYAILLQEENQRSMHHNQVVTSHSIAMSVKHSGGSKSSTTKESKRSLIDQVQRVCNYFHMTGHTKDKCFCLHGYPNWHRLFGKPKPKPRFNSTNMGKRHVIAAHVSTVDKSVNTGSSLQSDNALNLSDGQCKQLIEILQKSMQTTATNYDSTGSGWSPFSVNTMHLAGNIYHFTSTIDYTLSLNQNPWIVYTGATDHITPYHSLLCDIVPFKSILHLSNGETTPITHMGTVRMNNLVTLKNVLCVP